MMQLDHSGALPLRAQVEALLRNILVQKEYQQGALLPDEVKPARQLGVSRGILLRRHTVFDAGNRPLEFAEICYVNFRFTVTLDLQQKEE